MKVYLDESYPTTQEVVILGALFVPKGADKYLHHAFLEIKRKHGISKELKYSTIKSNKQLRAAKQAIKLFLKSSDPYLRVCIVPYGAEDLKPLPGKRKDLHRKRVYIYSHAAKELVLSHLLKDKKADLIMDEEDRIKGGRFSKEIKVAKTRNGSRIISVTQVHSHRDDTCLVQLCDLLIGAILQNLYPSNSKTGKIKNNLGIYFAKETGIKSFSKRRIKFKKSKIKISKWKLPSFKKSRS